MQAQRQAASLLNHQAGGEFYIDLLTISYRVFHILFIIKFETSAIAINKSRRRNPGNDSFQLSNSPKTDHQRNHVSTMKEFNPVEVVENSQLILDDNNWPNFHDAEVHNLNIWRGDIRPEDNVWIGPVIKATFELCALKEPYLVTLKFHDCDSIRMEEFNHQNAVYDLAFRYEARGNYRDGSPLPPHIVVRFEQAFGVALSFTCFRIQVVARSETGHG